MPDRFIESHIKRNPLFQNLHPQELDLIVKAFQVLRFQRGELIVKQGNPMQGLFIIVDGEATLTQDQPDGTERRVGVVGDGSVLDHGAVFNPGVEPYTVRVTQDATALFLSRNRMNTVLSYYPEVRNRINMAQRTDTPLKPTATSTVPAVQPPPTVPKPAPPAQNKQRQTGAYNIQRENEEIILIRRRHPWAFVRRGWVSVLIFALSAAIAAAMLNTNLPQALCFVPATFGTLIAGLLMVYFYLEWRNDSIVVTDNRVIKIERVIPTFSVQINEIPINRVQEVNTELPDGDLFARIFRYGNVELKNASDAGDMVLDTVPDPEAIQKAIFANQAERKKMAEINKRSAIRAEIEKNIGLTNTVKQAAQSGNLKDPEEMPLKPARTYSWSPARMTFTNDDGDTVYRKHITVWLGGVMPPTTLIFASIVLLFVSLFTNQTLQLPPFISQFGVLIALVMGVVGVLWFWWADWDWRNDMYILSDDRVTLIHRRPLWLQNEVEQILLNRVDNVKSETSGLIDSLFRRGDVVLSLVGEGIDQGKMFNKVHKPAEIQAEISRRQARAKLKEQEEEDRRQRQAINEYLSVYHETVQDAPPQRSPSPQQAQPPYPPVQSDDEVGPYRVNDNQRPPGIPRTRRDNR